MKKSIRAPILVLALLISGELAAQQRIASSKAKDHLGEKLKVCGKAVSIKFAQNARGAPTFLNLDKPYPDQIFTIVIWGNDRPKFPDVETLYQGRRICATGTIATYREVPEIVAHEPPQIELDVSTIPRVNHPVLTDPLDYFGYIKTYVEEIVRIKDKEYGSETSVLDDCRTKYANAMGIYTSWVDALARRIVEGKKKGKTTDYGEFLPKAQTAVEAFEQCPESVISQVPISPNQAMSFFQTPKQSSNAQPSTLKQSLIHDLLDRAQNFLMVLINKPQKVREEAADKLRKEYSWRTWEEITGKVPAQKPAGAKE